VQIFFGQDGVLQMRMSAFFAEKKNRHFFKKIMVCPHGRGRERGGYSTNYKVLI